MLKERLNGLFVSGLNNKKEFCYLDKCGNLNSIYRDKVSVLVRNYGLVSVKYRIDGEIGKVKNGKIFLNLELDSQSPYATDVIRDKKPTFVVFRKCSDIGKFSDFFCEIYIPVDKNIRISDGDSNMGFYQTKSLLRRLDYKLNEFSPDIFVGELGVRGDHSILAAHLGVEGKLS